MRTRESHSCGEVLGARLHIMIGDFLQVWKHLLQGERGDLGIDVSKDCLSFTVCRTVPFGLVQSYFEGLTFIIQHQVDRINNGLQVTYIRRLVGCKCDMESTYQRTIHPVAFLACHYCTRLVR